MQLRSLRHAAAIRPVDGYYARAAVPLTGATAGMADSLVGSFVTPLQGDLVRHALGRIARFSVEGPDPLTVLVIDLSLASDAPSHLLRVAEVLQTLGAPQGAFIGNAECPVMIRFGMRTRAEGQPATRSAGATKDALAEPAAGGAAAHPRRLPSPAPYRCDPLSVAMRGREPLMQEAVHRVMAAAALCRMPGDGPAH